MEDHAKPVRAPFLHSAQGKYVFTYVVVIAAILVLLNTYPVLASQNLVMQQSKKTALQTAEFIARKFGNP